MPASSGRPVGRILVTGANGFVGGHLLPVLRAAFPDAAIIPSGFDMTDTVAVQDGVQAARPDACVHLAAVSAVPAAQADADRAWRVNLGGTLTLARALATLPGCTLLFTSTADAYGQSFKRGVPLDETAALDPMNTYSATKAAADLALGAMAREGLHIVRARPFNHTGPGQLPSFVGCRLCAAGSADRRRAAAAGAERGGAGPNARFPGRAGRVPGLHAVPAAA